jgi:tRNA G10  N-methylase Trm11
LSSHLVPHLNKNRSRRRPEIAPGVSHPAVFSKQIMEFLPSLVDEQTHTVLDPFAGTGKIHDIDFSQSASQIYTIGLEIEPEWAHLRKGTFVGNARYLPFRSHSIDAVITSPAYGNRLADKHNASDGSVRRSYKHDLGRDLHADNAGGFQWGQQYRTFHGHVWQECFRVIKPSGRLILNISDHIRKGERQPVSSWHLSCLLGLGFVLTDCHRVSTNRLREGANSLARIDGEFIFVFDR